MLRADGIVDFDKSICIGCKACMAAYPLRPSYQSEITRLRKQLPARIIDVRLEPACVVVARAGDLIGDMNDQSSYVAQIVIAAGERRRRKKRRCRNFLQRRALSALDPLAARRRSRLVRNGVNSASPAACRFRNPTYGNSSATLFKLRRAHSIPWDWRVVYTEPKASLRRLPGRRIARLVWVPAIR
jgi:Fe-S-cluster-containing dehydrogenase component